MTGLYTPSHGAVLLDDTAVGDWDPEALHRRFDVIFQDFNYAQLFELQARAYP